MQATKVNLQRLRRLLLPIQERSLRENHHVYSGDKVVDKFICSNPFAFLIGVISDQSMPADRAWKLPYLLKERLGHLESGKIALLSEAQLEKIIRNPVSLHRFPRTLANWIIKAAKLVETSYNGDAKNIWSGVDSAFEIQKRLCEFAGISQKKSTMMTKMLIQDWDLKVNDLPSIDLPYDIHIRRVMQRTGLARNDSLGEIQKAGRMLNPAYPAYYDDAVWIIGSEFCHSRNPDHKNCPLEGACQKLNKKVESN